MRAPSPGRTASGRSGSGGAASRCWPEPSPAGPVTAAFRACPATGPILTPARSRPPAARRPWHASGMASQAAPGGTPTAGPAVAVVVGEEELLVERAVARLVAAASAATGQDSTGQDSTGQPGTGQPGAGQGPFPAGSDVHEVSGGALGPGDLSALTAPSLFGGGCVVVIRDAHNAGKDVAGELARLAAEP